MSPPSKPQPLLLFLHIPKTAGTSVMDFLVNRFPAGQFHHIGLEWADFPPKFLPPQLTGCLAGHVAYRNVMKYLPDDTRVFTVLRDPIERSFSAYSFYHNIPREELARYSPHLLPIQDLSMKEFIENHPVVARRVFGNSMTTHLAREYLQRHDWVPRPVDRYDCEIAKRNLSRCVVGLTEHLHDSLVMLSQEYGWVPPDRVSESNRSPKKSKSYDPEVLAWLQESTAHDIELYDYGRKLFQEQWKRHCEREPLTTAGLPLVEQYCLNFEKPIPGYGWHRREHLGGVSFCHSDSRAWLSCPPVAGSRLKVEIETISLLPPEHQSPLELRINGTPVQVTPVERELGRCYLGELDLQQPSTEPIRLDFHIPRAVRPCDVIPGSEDKRLLGLAFKEVRVRAA
ncbi:MAG: sulfotransferase family 2 domain-containing protein [Gemmataceae bacterium]